MSDDRLRLDKWLWYARFFKSRSIATRALAGGGVRVNRQLIAKPHATVKVDDVVTFPLGRHIRVIQVLALGTRRGPAPEARTLYEDLSPPAARASPASATADSTPRGPAPREPGAGRPTKAQRRALDRLRDDG